MNPNRETVRQYLKRKGVDIKGKETSELFELYSLNRASDFFGDALSADRHNAQVIADRLKAQTYLQPKSR